MHILHTYSIDTLNSISHFGHTWDFVEIDMSNVEAVYKCNKCLLFCFIEMHFAKSGTFKFHISMDENITCKSYQEERKKIIATHDFEITDSPYGFRCAKCHIECGTSARKRSNGYPDILFRPLWADTSLITCSEVKLHNIML